MTPTKMKLRYFPAHPLNLPLKELVAEMHGQASHFPDVKRSATLYVDRDDCWRLLICFRRGGSIDNSRNYAAVYGKRSQYGDPRNEYGALDQLAESCEEQFLAELTKVFGKASRAGQ